MLKRALEKLLPNTGIETIHGKHYMRFELAGEGIQNRLERIRQATARGTEIYTQLIGNDEIIITIEDWNDNWLDSDSRNTKLLEQLLRDSELKRLKGPFEQIYFEKDERGMNIEKVSDEKLECDLIIGKAKLTIDQVTAIIKGIASLEMGEEPCIPQSVYFFSIKKQTGFRIYDDRGCDVWANSIETLRFVYVKLNAWILDYNRLEIDKMFDVKY